jgi:NTE family protein
MSHKKIGLVLSGGGARGIAHIGVLKGLQELGIEPGVISGTSSGAVIGAFFAAGYTPSEIAEIIFGNKFFHFSDLAWNTSGFLASDENEKMFRTYLKRKRFNDLNIPLYVSATDILKGEAVFFSSGDVVKAILASSAIPIIFAPVHYKNRMLIDGSAITCFPTEPLLNKCEALIGVYVNPINKIRGISGMINIFDRGYHLTLYNEVRPKKILCDVFIEPAELVNYSMFDFKKGKELIEIGYKSVMKQRKKFLSIK